MAIDYPYPQSDNSFENQVNAMSKFNCISDLNKIKLPTLIISGENDILFPFLESAEFFNNISHFQKTTISRAAHSIHIENPEDFCMSIVKFLND